MSDSSRFEFRAVRRCRGVAAACIRALVFAFTAMVLLPGCGDEAAFDLQMEGLQKASAGDNAGALVALNRAVALEPNDVTILLARAGVHDASGNPGAAVADYEKAIALAPNIAPGIAAQLEYLREQAGLPATRSKMAMRTKKGKPSLTHLTFCAMEPAGFQDYREQPGAEYRLGDTVWIYLDVDDLASRAGNEGSRESAFRQSLRLRDPLGKVLMHEVVVDGVHAVKRGADSESLFLRNRIPIPGSAPAGVYQVDLIVEDTLTGAIAQADGEFIVTR